MRTKAYRHQTDLDRFIRERREELGLTPQQLANEMNVSHSMVKYLELGGSSHFPATLEKLADILKCDLAKLQELNNEASRRKTKPATTVPSPPEEPISQPENGPYPKESEEIHRTVICTEVYPHQTDLGRFIQNRRVELGLTLYQVAVALSTSYENILRIETAGGGHHPGTLYRLAKILRCDLGQIEDLNKQASCKESKTEELAKEIKRVPFNVLVGVYHLQRHNIKLTIERLSTLLNVTPIYVTNQLQECARRGWLTGSVKNGFSLAIDPEEPIWVWKAPSELRESHLTSLKKAHAESHLNEIPATESIVQIKQDIEELDTTIGEMTKKRNALRAALKRLEP